MNSPGFSKSDTNLPRSCPSRRPHAPHSTDHTQRRQRQRNFGGHQEAAARNKKETHTHLTALFLGLPRWVGTRNVKPIWILLKQEIVSGSGISWAICKSATRSRQITTPAHHRSVFYAPGALPAAQPTASKHWIRKRVLILLDDNVGATESAASPCEVCAKPAKL